MFCLLSAIITMVDENLKLVVGRRKVVGDGPSGGPLAARHAHNIEKRAALPDAPQARCGPDQGSFPPLTF